MDQTDKTHISPPFNEDELLKMIFLLSDAQNWFNDLVNGAMLHRYSH